MAVQDVPQTIKVRFNDSYSEYFDELINVQITNRKSDTGLIEKNRPMLRPRAGSYRVGNELISTWSSTTAYIIGDVVEYSGIQYEATAPSTNSQPPSANWTVVTKWNSDGIFYTDRTRTRRFYRVWNNKLWYLNSTTWTSIKDLQTNNVKLQIQRVPLNISGSAPTTYTMGSATTAAETVYKDAADAGWAANIGKICMVTSGVYKWAFAPIIDYQSSGTKYVLWWAGILLWMPAGTTYVICDTTGDALQVCRWYESNASYNDDLYFNGITEMTYLKWYATSALRNVYAITSSEWIRRSASFLNKVWTFSGSTLFYSGGYPGNPFFYDFTGSITTGSAGEIIDIFPFKNRLIVIGTSFIYALTSSLTWDKLVESYGWILNWVVSTGEDVYIVTTQGTLISINETISGFIELKNIARDVDNYLKNFTTNISAWFDGRYMYIYGESGTLWVGKMCVLDIRYKFWSIFEWLPPIRIIPEQWSVYLLDNNTDIVRVLSLLYTTDVAVGTDKTNSVEQRVTLKELDLDDIFSQKILPEVYISFENYDQQVEVTTYYALDGRNAKKSTATFNINAVNITEATIGNNLIWDNMFWGEQALSEISVPIIRRVMYSADSANIFKLSITWKDGSFFYINAIDIMMGFFDSPKKYFGSLQTK